MTRRPFRLSTMTGCAVLRRDGGRRRRSVFLLMLGLLGVLLAAAACSQASSETHVLAVVNGKPITQGEFDYRWAELSDSARGRYESQGGKKKFLDDLISREILLQEARRR